MTKIPAKPDELKKAFHIHSNAILENASISYNLLLFYAVESGLKAIYLKDCKPRLHNTGEILDDRLWNNGGHNLNEWFKELKVPASGICHCHGFRLKRDDSQKTWSICHAHQAWRYGIRIDDNDQQRLIQWLEAVRNLLKEII